MGLNATARRRWLGALVLLAALAMLVAGETALKNQLTEPSTFLVYWLVCFGFTGTAILIAFLDVRALHARTREEQRDLVHRTLKEIETDARGKARNPDREITDAP